MAGSSSRVVSAGIALLRGSVDEPEILLVHPGGPFWVSKDDHAWSIPKGELSDDEDAGATARREFTEETGHLVPAGPLVELPELRLGSSSKHLLAFALAGDVDADAITSNTFEMEWPPRSGQRQAFPEVDSAAWFDFNQARTKLHKGQVGLLDLLSPIVTVLLA